MALLWRLCATESAAYKPSKKPVRGSSILVSFILFIFLAGHFSCEPRAASGSQRLIFSLNFITAK
jgi:hypothetical protein